MNAPVPERESVAENLISWFAAAVLVATGVIYAQKLDAHRRRPKPARIIPNPTPAQEPLVLQERRAAEPGRGRDASAPLQIPWRGWKDILVRTFWDIQRDRLLGLAGSVVFYCLVALVPALAAGVSSYALFFDAGTIAKHLAIVADIVPAGTIEMLHTEITRIAAKSDGRLTFGFLLGLGIALWSANAGMKSIIDALNVIYNEEEKRGIIWLNVELLFFTVCSIAGAALAIAAVVVFPLVLAGLGLSSLDAPTIGYLRWPLLFAMVIVGLAVLYRLVPAGGGRNGAGSASEAFSRRRPGSRCPRCFPGILAISPTTTRHTVRSARWWG